MQDLVITTVAGVKLPLRFDMGTARVLKTVSDIDVIAGNENANTTSMPEKIFLAAYKRGCALYKLVPELTDSEATEAFYELTTKEAMSIMQYFTAAVSAEPDAVSSNAAPVNTNAEKPAEEAEGAAEGKNV